MEIYSAIFAGLGGMLGWGLADFFAKKTVGKISAIKAFLYSHIFGLIILLIYLVFNPEPINPGTSIIFFLILFGLADLAAYTLFYRGLEKGLVSVIAPIVASNGGLAALISFLLFKEAIFAMRWVGLVIVFVGTILIVFQLQKGIQGGFSIKSATKGLPEALASMTIWGFFFPSWNWFLDSHKDGLVIFLTWVTIVETIGAFILVYLVAKLRKNKTGVLVKGRKIWFWLFLIGSFTTLASLTVALGFKFTTVTSVITILSTAAALPTIILARIFLKEKLSFNQIIGAAFIVGGLIILAL